MQSPFANLTPVVKNLIIINVLVYIAMFALRQFVDLGALFSAYYIGSPLFKPWQIITYMFMHSPIDFKHILFNMIALFMFGPILEGTLGSKKFFNLYFLSGIGGYLLNMLVHAIQIYNIVGAFTISHPELDASYFAFGGGQAQAEHLYALYNGSMVGASGAIFGMLVAFGMLFPNMEMMILFIPVPIKAKYVVIGYIALELFSGFKGFAGDPVAHFAHLGGALFGFILIKIWGLKSTNNYY
ncbi:rhomboid family intramembrane serine protease [Mucilaginibacter sp. ZT4R22]|uniref:Rhomboid family intramembrane serine protease n=1 Tax=Mucilaginibacter pankratovii TaxID=2772110 RepID=A0ABR7WTP4_9SPHI|nr:rhomboid family intramembrane serine protease [Mucilaginibacter pankratovii]MBD1365650.1 rhomboid family intramembrane serine protease [Mucilaginibacter pankratovii]